MSDVQDAPRYRLLQKSYIPREPRADIAVLDPGTEIVFLGIPGPHMEPLNDAARLAYDLSGVAGRTIDPFGSVPIGKAESDAQLTGEAVGKAINDALTPTMAMMVEMQRQMLALMQPGAAPTKAAAPPPPPPPPPPSKGKG